MTPAAFVPLLAAWVLSSSRRGRGVVAALDALAFLSTAVFWNSPNASSFGLFLSASIFAALTFAALSPEQDLDGLARLHLGASLSIVATTANSLSWSVPAILLSGLVVQPTWWRLHLLLVPGVVALAGLLPVVGVVPVVPGLWAGWLVASREVLRRTTVGLVTRMAISFILLVAVFSVALRLPVGFRLQTLALGSLAVGALGALASKRVTTFLTSILLARAGLVLFAELGGILGRAPALLMLAASGASVLLLAAALEKTETLDDVSRLGSPPRTMVLSLAALSLGSFPPFPGFFTLFPLSSAVVERGYGLSLLVAAALLFLLALGTLRLVIRAFESGGTRTIEAGIGRAAIVLAFAAILAFSVAPAFLLEIARAAALSLSQRL
jgi:hypothetical protein